MTPITQQLRIPTHDKVIGPLARTVGEQDVQSKQSTALLTILGSTGELLDEREEFTFADDDYTASSVDRCIRWNDGALLTGYARGRDAKYTSSWMTKLDGNGQTQWQQSLAPGSFLIGAAGAADRDLVTVQMARNADDMTLSTLEKWTEKGEPVVTSAPIKGDNHYMLRSVYPDRGLAVLSYDALRNSYQLNLLSERLDKVERRTPRIISLQEGFGFRLLDESMVLFGSTMTPYGLRGAIQWISKNGEQMASSVIGQVLNSVTFGDAVPMAANQFIAVASQNAYASRTHGLFMSWITLH